MEAFKDEMIVSESAASVHTPPTEGMFVDRSVNGPPSARETMSDHSFGNPHFSKTLVVTLACARPANHLTIANDFPMIVYSFAADCALNP